MTIGKLKFQPPASLPQLVSESVLKMIHSMEGFEIGVSEIDPTLSDTSSFCQNYNINPQSAANCVILEAKRGDKTWLAACVVLATTRADINGLARKTLDARRVSFAPMEKAVELTKMEYGAITPIGLPSDWQILVDKKVTESEYVIIGSGIRKSKLLISGKAFSIIPNVTILENLGRVVEISTP